MLKNPSHNWEIGDICYYHERWADTINRAIIVDIMNRVVKLHDMNIGGNVECRMSSIFKTDEEALAVLDEKNKEQVDKYRSEIQTMEDLVRFGYTHCVHTGAEEYTDWNARKAYAAMAERLMGIQLEP